MPFEFDLYQVLADTKFIISVLAPFKWIILPVLVIFLLLILKDAFLFWRQNIYKSKIEWDIIEIRIPREIRKGPKAMEQFFNGLATLRNYPAGFKELYIDGQVIVWFSLEIVGSDGKLKFYMKVPKKQRSTIESMLYAHYPDIEITDAQDYVDSIPSSFDGLKQIGYDLFGTEVILGKPSPYPINTYQSFEQAEGEERIIDPISVLMELVSKLKKDENIWIQFLLRPAHPSWVKEGEALIEELKKKGAEPVSIGESEHGPVVSPRGLAPGEEEILKFIGRKISKPAFETLIRFIYIAPKDIYNPGVAMSFMSYFSQYSTGHLNFFRPNVKTLTSAKWYKWPYIFPKKREKNKKRKLLYKYRARFLPEESLIGRIMESSILSPELDKKASISTLTAPVTERIESKKISPPAYIPY